MKPIVVDTDVVSFLFKNDSRAQSYLPHLYDRQWFISFMTKPNWNSGRFCRTGTQSGLTGCGSFSRDS